MDDYPRAWHGVQSGIFHHLLTGGSASFLPKVDCFVDGKGRKQEGVFRESFETYSIKIQSITLKLILSKQSTKVCSCR